MSTGIAIGNFVGQGNSGDFQTNQYTSLVTAGGGTVLSSSTVTAIYQFLQQNNLLDTSQLIFDANSGMVQRVDGVLKYIRTAFDLSPTPKNLDGSATATVQPRLVGGIAPNSKFAASNQNGEARYFTHSSISFTDVQPWSAVAVVKINQTRNSDDGNSIFGKAAESDIAIGIPSSPLRYSFNNSAGTAYTGAANKTGKLIAKSSILHFIAAGDGSLKVYVNGILDDTITAVTSFNFVKLFAGRYGKSYGSNYYARIQSGAMTAAQVLSEATFLRTLYSEIESTVIGTQEWSTRNFEAVCTPMGNVIPEMQAATAVEKIVNGDLWTGATGITPPNSWSKSGAATPTYSIIDLSAVTNFDTDVLNFTADGIISTIQGTLTSGKYYRVRCSYRTDSAANYLGIGTTAMKFLLSNTGLVGDAVLVDTILKSTGVNLLIQIITAGSTIQIDNVSVQELGWANSTEIYDAVYAATAGTAAEKHYAACKEAGMWCYYNNDAANGATYGKLYNWYAVSLLDLDFASASFGWRVPTSAQFTTLQTYLGGAPVAGGKLKMTGTDYWVTPNTGADNSTGFTALGGGYRNNLGVPTNLTGSIILGTATTDGTYFTTLSLSNTSAATTITAFQNLKVGVSLRLIKI